VKRPILTVRKTYNTSKGRAKKVEEERETDKSMQQTTYLIDDGRAVSHSNSHSSPLLGLTLAVTDLVTAIQYASPRASLQCQFVAPVRRRSGPPKEM
jgi:hypothetical protein